MNRWWSGLWACIIVLGSLVAVASWAVTSKPGARSNVALGSKPIAKKLAPSCDAQMDRYMLQCVTTIKQRWTPKVLEHGVERSLQTRLHFFVTPSGKLSDLRVIKSSGYGWYDQDLLNTVRQIGSFPKPPVCNSSGIGVMSTFGTRVSTIKRSVSLPDDNEVPVGETEQPTTLEGPSTPDDEAVTLPVKPLAPMAGPPKPYTTPPGDEAKKPPAPTLPNSLTPAKPLATNKPAVNSALPSALPSAPALPDRKALAQRTFDAVNLGPGVGWKPAESKPTADTDTLPPENSVCATALEPYVEQLQATILKRIHLPAYTADLSAEMELTINTKGFLQAATLVRPSGDVRLDQELVQGAWAAAPFSPLPSACSLVKTVSIRVGYQVSRSGPKPLLNQLIDRHKKPMTY